MTDGELLAEMGTDGRKWAAEFLRRYRVGRAWPEAVIKDQLDLMTTWFAKAIEAGRDAGAAAR